MAELIQNIIIVVGLVAVGVIGYFMWQETQQQSVETAIDEQALTSAVILRQIAALKEIDLDTSLFNDPQFSELRSYRQNINPISVGNSNPFVR